ncbi:MAG: tandem-95 repeat protein [Bacteroidota bacterium]
MAQNFITVPFTNGFVGRNTANNAADSCYYLFDLGWKDIQFAQYSTADVFVAQGNDIIGMVIITDKNNVRHIINGFIKWRNPSGNSPNTMVFQPSASANSILATQSPYPQNSYLLNDTRYIGLTFNNTTITITGGNGGTISGNAATTGLLTSLNNYLATFPKINVSNADTTFYESDLTATVRVRLSITPTDTIKVKYKTENGTALAGSDFTAKTNDSLIFIPGDTVEFATVNLTNDGVSESPERFVLRLFQPTNASIIRDSASVRILDPLTSSITSQSNISCGANPTLGSATVNPIGGLAPYTYSWSPSGGNSATASGLNAGSYVCTITDSRGRTTTQNVTITVAANWTKLYETTNPSRDGSGSIVYVPGFGKTGGAASSFTGGFNRVRYRLENNISGTLRWAEVSFDAWSGLNAAGLQIPDLVNNLVNQRNVFNIEVNSNMPGVNTGRFDSGRIEMWPHNYVPAVSGILFPSGNGSNYDWDDTRSTSGDHGSFQIHNISSSSRQTILAWNMHRNGGPAEIGLGNAPTGDPDWTFNTSNGSTNFKVQVFVSDLPDVSLVSGNQTQAVCSGSAITPTVYSYGNGATGVVVSNLPAGVTSSIDTTLKRVTISGNPTAAGTYRIFTTGHPAACTADTILGSITINPAPSISTTTSNSRCGAGSVNLSANASAGTVNWFANLTGGTVLFTGSNFTTPSISASTTYYVEATNNGCSTVPRVSVVATINAAPTATATASGSTAICQGGSVVINANTGTGLTYQWRNASGNIPGAINASLTANAAGAYKVVVTNTNGCIDSSAAVSVTVNALPTATATAATSTTFCQGGSVVINANTGTGLTYQWRNSGVNIPLATTSSLTATASGSYRAVVTNTNGCVDSSAAVTVTVVPSIASNTIATSQSILINTAPAQLTGTLPTGGTGSYTYSWLVSTTGATSGFSAIGSTNTQNYSPSVLSQNTWYRRLVTSGSCSDTTAAVSITVNANIANNTISAAQTICSGNTPAGLTGLTPSGGTGSFTYTWLRSTTSASTGFSAAPGTNNAQNYTPGALTQTSWYRRYVVSGSASDTSAAIQITVSPVIAANTATGTQSICTGQTPTAIAGSTPTGGSGTYTYSWLSSTTSTTAGYTSATGTNNSQNYAPAALTASTWYRRLVTSGGCSDTSAAASVTVNALPTATATAATATTFCQGGSVVINANTGTGLTYQWRNASGNISGATNASFTANSSGSYRVVVINANGCSDTSVAISVTVNALPTATAIAATSTTFCQGGSVVINANTGTGLTYQWRNASGNIPGATNASLTANVAGAYKVVVTNTNGCVDSSAAVSVTVNALPTATATAATSTTFCQGGSVVINANTGTGLTYQWRNASGNIPGATNASLTANAAGAYKVVVTNTNGCVDSSAAVSVTVNALPTATATAATATTFCQGDSVVINANTGTGLTYQWRNAGINIPLATSSNFKATASGSYRVVVTNTNGCLDSSSAIIVTVNSIPSISSVTSASRCGNGTIVLGATASAGIVNWYTSITGGISVGTGTSFTTPAINATTTYYVDASNNGCTTATRSSVVATVNPNLTASVSINASTTSVCGSSPITFTATPTNGGTNPTYQWKLNGNNVGTGGTSYILSNPVVGDSVNVVMTSNATPCLLNSTANAIGIKLNNSTVTPSVSIVSNQGSTVCAGASVTFTATALNGGTTPSFQWYRNNIAVGTNASTYITTLLAQGDSIRVALTSNAACLTTSTAQSNILVMTVNNLPSITAQPILQRIITGSQANFSVTATNANTYQWQSSNGGSFSNLTNGSVYSGVSTASLTILNSAGLNNTLYRVVTTNTCGNRQSDSVPLFINTKPLALNDTLNVAQGKSDSVAVLLNDTDPDGQLFNPVIIVGPINGTAVVLPSGKIQYTPGANYYGLDTITYRVCDNGNPIACDTARVFIRINAKPIASRDTISVNEDDSVIFNVRLNDLDPDGTLSNPVIINPPANGTIIILPNGNIKFKPNPNFFGLDSFMYRVCDNGMPVICDSAWVRLIVNSVNDGPDAVNDSININEDDSVIINVRINDTDIDGTLGNPITVTNPINGTISILPNGNIKYIPNPDYFGLDSFMYRVCDNGMPVKCDSAWVRLIINPVNDGPDAVNDSININEDDSVIINVRINDTDIDGTLSNPIAITNPRNGTISILPNGNIKYIPNPNYFGLDSFMYRVCDNGMPVKCVCAWVRLIIKSVNDGPDAEDDSLTVNENNPVILDLRNNDKDIDGSLGNPVILVGPLNGSAVINPNGTVTYTPKPNYNGVDSFMYRVCDNGIPVRCDSAWVRIKINPVNTAPNAIDDTLIVDEDNAITTDLRNNDIDLDGNLTNPTIRIMPKHGIVVVNNDGLITYTPTADYFGLDSFFYQVCDNGTPVLCDSAWVRITVRPVNDSPNAINDTANTNVNIPVSIAVLLNDVDKDGTINNPIIITNPTSGVAVVNANGTITYTPANGFVGTISFSYRVCDNGTPARCDSAWATVNVLNNIQNLPPIALNDTIKVIENSKIKFDVRSNDIDPDTNGLGKPIAITQPKFGTIQSTDDSNFIYVPFINYTGTDKFSYSISDLGSPAKFDTAEVIIEVSEQSVKIPDGFSPDGDGVNDRFVIPGIEKYPNNKLTIVNRWGEAVYVMEKYNNSWGGEPNMGFTLENGILPAGAYFYILETGTADKPLTGSLYINK